MRRRASFAVKRARESPTAFIAPLGAGRPRICASGSKRRRLHFVRSLPPARTEREWLAAGLVEQARRERAPLEVERTR